MVDKEHIQNFPPQITEKRIWNLNNFFVALVIGLVIIICFFTITTYFNLNFLNRVVLMSFFVVIYAIILFFFLEPKVIQEISHMKLKTIIQQTSEPTIKEVIVEKPVQIPYETEKRIYITNTEAPTFISAIRKKLFIPKYKYIGSTQTKTYHKKSCRLSKLIKNKYKLLNNNPNYFIRKNFKSCKICIRHLRKI